VANIFKTTGFIPYVLVVFLNAFVDLGHKIIIQNTVFKIEDGQSQIILIAVVNAMILLPFVLLFTPAGFLSDKFPKPKIMRIVAFVAIILTLLITFFYYQGMYLAAFFMTLMLATQSAIYSPTKYGMIKLLIGDKRLTAGNAIVQAATIIAILSGIFVFSILFEDYLAGYIFATETDILQKIAPIGWILVACSVVEFSLTFAIPRFKAGDPDKKFEFQKYIKGKYLTFNLSSILHSKIILISILGLAGFWSMSQVTLAAFPAFAKQNLHIENTVIVQGILACAGIGIFLGSTLVSQLSKTTIEKGLIPLGALGMSLALLSIPQITSIPLMLSAFITLGLFGSFFIVPLNALIQHHADDARIGTVLAANNFVQNIFMLSFLGLTIFFAYNGFDSKILLHIIGGLSLVILAVTMKKLIKDLAYFILGRIFAVRYKINVIGNLPETGAVLLLGNHISYLDWAILQIASPRPIHFVMERKYYDWPLVKQFLNFFGVIPIASGRSKEALQRANALLKQGDVVCLFPEGGISYNGQMDEFKRGFERAASAVDGVIVPFYIQGLWGSRFSRSNNYFAKYSRDSLRRKIYISFGQKLSITSNAGQVKRKVFDASVLAWDAAAEHFGCLTSAWLRQVKHKPNKLCIADTIGGEVKRLRAFTGAVLFSKLIKEYSKGQNVGAILPASSAGIITNAACLLLGKTIVNLNFTSSLKALKLAVKKAEISEIYTSSRFMEKLKAKGVDLEPLLEKVKVYYLEDLKNQVSVLAKIRTILTIKLLPKFILSALYITKAKPHAPACIMFSSGSEGTPKGVVLTHKNIHANARQVLQIYHPEASDVVMSNLPLFHSFGFTVTSIMPLIGGIPLICHPDPTDALNIAKAIAKYKVTFYCGTSTFIHMFTKNKRVFPQMLASLRYIVAGAEKLRPEIRHEFQAKFNQEILEGYGATETAPVASVNMPDFLDTKGWRIHKGNSIGSVGTALPGTSIRIIDPDTHEELLPGEDGLIVIAGPQLMQGYLEDDEKTQNALVELDGIRWYKTGDKGHMDEEGFVTIVDRYSRFAKIGGEMVSLGAVEGAIQEILEEAKVEIATVNVPHSRKGEQIVLLFAGKLGAEDIMGMIRQSGISPLMHPSKIFNVTEIPKLGSGKCDFSRLKKLALSLLGKKK